MVVSWKTMVCLAFLIATTTATSPPCAAHITGANGHVHPSLTLTQTPTAGQGLGTTTPLPPDTTVASIPISSMLSVDNAYRSPIGRALYDANLPDAQALAIYLLYVRAYPDADPQMTPGHRCHIHSLPAPEDLHVPIGWSPQELRELGDSNVGVRARMDKTRLRAAWKAWSRPIISAVTRLHREESMDTRPRDVFAYSHFGWAMAIVSSRVFRVALPDYQLIALVPILDMGNTDHIDGVNTIEAVSQDGSSLALRTTREVLPGEQLFVHYGRHQLTPSTLFLSYGFMPNLEDALDPALNYGCDVTYSLPPDGENGGKRREVPLLVAIGGAYHIHPHITANVVPAQLLKELESLSQTTTARARALAFQYQGVETLSPRLELSQAVLDLEAAWYARALSSFDELTTPVSTDPNDRRTDPKGQRTDSNDQRTDPNDRRTDPNDRRIEL